MKERPLAKVIDLFTRVEVSKLPFDADNSRDIMDYLMQYKNPRTGAQITPAEFEIIEHLLFMLENNSGTKRQEVFERGA